MFKSRSNDRSAYNHQTLTSKKSASMPKKNDNCSNSNSNNKNNKQKKTKKEKKNERKKKDNQQRQQQKSNEHGTCVEAHPKAGEKLTAFYMRCHCGGVTGIPGTKWGEDKIRAHMKSHEHKQWAKAAKNKY